MSMDSVWDSFVKPSETDKKDEKKKEQPKTNLTSEISKQPEAVQPATTTVQPVVNPVEAVKPIFLEEQVRMTQEDFDFSEEPVGTKKTFMVYAEKGEGKTYFALSFKGTKACISFDQKSADIKSEIYNNDKDIHIYDGVRYLNKMTPDMFIKSADRSFEYLNFLLDGTIRALKPDWIILDGLEILVRDICEMRMRYHEGLQAFEPFDFKLWAERNLYVDQIHLLCMNIAQKGVIYTAYVNDKAIKIVNREIIETKREPKWAGDVKYRTDVVIRLDTEEGDDIRKYVAYVESSKINAIKTGLKVDITGGGVEKLMKEA